MSNFPVCPKWAAGVSYKIPLSKTCTLHVPMAGCITQKEVVLLSEKITEFVQIQQLEDQGAPAGQLKIEKLKQLERDYNKLVAQAREVEHKHKQLIEELKDETDLLK